MQSNDRRIRVLHAPYNYANQAFVVSEALRAQGIDSSLLVYRWMNSADRFGYGQDRVAQIKSSDWLRQELDILQEVIGSDYDVLHFWHRTLVYRTGNENFFNGLDLPFLRLAGRRTVYRFTGYELRRKSLELQLNPFSPFRYGFESRYDEESQKKYLDFVAPYVDAFVVQDPEMRSYLPQARIVPRALNLEQFPVAEAIAKPRPLVVHAPTDRLLKGSDFIIKAVDALKEEGLDFDFQLIENMQHAEAMRWYRRADIVVDQLLIGWYGVVAVEAMAMGKAVIAYIRDDVIDYFRNGMPLLAANPETIVGVLRQAIIDRDLRETMGRKARAFVEQEHDSRIVAGTLIELYRELLAGVPAPVAPPDLGYQIRLSTELIQQANLGVMARTKHIPDLYKATAQVKRLQRQVETLRAKQKELEAQAADSKGAATARTEDALQSDETITLDVRAERLTGRTGDLSRELDEAIAQKTELEQQVRALNKRQEALIGELMPLRYKAGRYEELANELPPLRYKALQYDEVKDRLPVWRAKAERYDRTITKGWRQFVPPVLGLRLPRRAVRVETKTAEGKPVEANTAKIAATAGEQDTEKVAPRSDGRAAAPSQLPKDAAALGKKGLVCILSRKELRSVTRVPRMAKALTDAGCGVTVVSMRAPVRELQEMCAETEFLEVSPLGPITEQLRGYLNGRLARRRQRQRRRENAYKKAVRAGGLRGAAFTARRWTMMLLMPLASLGELARRLFFVTPCALVLKKGDQTFGALYHDLAEQETLRIVIALVMQMQQVAVTRAFAAAASRVTRNRRFDVVQAHDNYALVAAARLARRDKAKLIYDAVELSSFRLATNFSRFERVRERLERWQESRIFRKADAWTTVGDGLANWYAQHYPIRRPLVVRNCRYYWPYEVDTRLRADAGVGSEVPLVVWFGGAYPQQGIEILIDALPLMAPQIHVAIVAAALPRWVAYVEEELPKRAAALGVGDRVHVLPPRDPNDLVPYVSGADLATIPRPSEHPNNFFSMPNKFLESVMARLPIAASRLGDIVDVINKLEIGDVFDERDLNSVATVIGRMLEPETNRRLKANVMKAAEEMTWEKESAPYVAAVSALLMPSGEEISVGAPSGERVEPRANQTAAN